VATSNLLISFDAPLGRKRELVRDFPVNGRRILQEGVGARKKEGVNVHSPYIAALCERHTVPIFQNLGENCGTHYSCVVCVGDLNNSTTIFTQPHFLIPSLPPPRSAKTEELIIALYKRNVPGLGTRYLELPMVVYLNYVESYEHNLKLQVCDWSGTGTRSGGRL
jgi:hypothetical protein